MAEQTGTLWEHMGASASCNHGFASYVLYWLKQLENATWSFRLINSPPNNELHPDTYWVGVH